MQSLTLLLLLLFFLTNRRFWQKSMIRGLTVLDLAVIFFLVAVNGSWLVGSFVSNWRLLPARALQLVYVQPTKVRFN
jgi:uncharacterized integral membrane protein